MSKEIHRTFDESGPVGPRRVEEINQLAQSQDQSGHNPLTEGVYHPGQLDKGQWPYGDQSSITNEELEIKLVHEPIKSAGDTERWMVCGEGFIIQVHQKIYDIINCLTQRNKELEEVMKYAVTAAEHKREIQKLEGEVKKLQIKNDGLREEARADGEHHIGLGHDIERLEVEKQALEQQNAQLIGLIDECRLQIEYLTEKFGETGTSNQVLAKIKNLKAP